MSLELLFLLWNQTTLELKPFYQEKLFTSGLILLLEGKSKMTSHKHPWHKSTPIFMPKCNELLTKSSGRIFK